MKTADTREEFDHLVRALSHDMSANLMLLERSFRCLKDSLAEPDRRALARADRAHDGVNLHVAEVEACLRESKRFLDDLMQLARTGNIEMQSCRVKVAELVGEILLEQHELLREHGVEVTVCQGLPIVWCNPGRLKQVITNLVRNAALHGGDPKHPRITIGPYRATGEVESGARSAADTFVVHDNGPGIDLRHAGEIFLPGRRLPSTTAEGSGMGLAIVKKIVDYYEGEVYVDSKCRSGTAFVVCLPVRQPKPEQATQPGPRRAKADRRWKLQPTGHSEDPVAPRHGPLVPQTHDLR